MPHVYTKLWIHAVLSTKDRTPSITPPLEPSLYNYLHDQMMEMGCVIKVINGTPDHIHILFLQNPGKSLAEIIRNLKRNSSQWVNQQDMPLRKFMWQTGYAAFAVSESQVQRVYNYISNQKIHHEKEDFIEEYRHIIELHKLKIDTNP